MKVHAFRIWNPNVLGSDVKDLYCLLVLRDVKLEESNIVYYIEYTIYNKEDRPPMVIEQSIKGKVFPGEKELLEYVKKKIKSKSSVIQKVDDTDLPDELKEYIQEIENRPLVTNKCSY